MNWNTIYLYLKNNGIDVYSPGQKTDLCTDNYVVVKDGGQYGLGGNKNGYSTIELILFIPLSKYSTVDVYKKEVKALMKGLNVRFTGNETPTIIDDLVKAHTLSIEYQIFKRL